MHVIPQEFENVLQTSQRYKSGVNCPPNEAWKMIASIDKLKARPYLEGNDLVIGLLTKASKAYQTGLEISSNRSSYKAADVTRQFMQASDLVLNAFNAYSSSKDLQVTNQNAVNTTPDLLSTASTVHEFMTPYYGDQSNKVQRCVRFVEKTDTMPVVFQEGAITCNPRPAQFGKGLEAWMSFKKQPNTIWIVGRTGNAFDANKDVIDFIRQYFPNLTFFNNIILFAREVAEWNKDEPLSGSPLQSPFGQPFDVNYKAFSSSDPNTTSYKAADIDAMGLILGKLKKIGDNVKAIIGRSLSVTGYSFFVITMRTYIGLVVTLVNLVKRIKGENYYEGDPSKHIFLIEQIKKAFAEIDQEVGKGNPNDEFVSAKCRDIVRLIDQIFDVFTVEYKNYQTNMRGKSLEYNPRAKSFLAYSLAAEAGTIKADLRDPRNFGLTSTLTLMSTSKSTLPKLDIKTIDADLGAMKANFGATVKYLVKAILRGLVEVIGWTAYNLTALTFDIVLSAISNGLHLIVQLWDKLRVMLIERDIKNDPLHNQAPYYDYIKYQDQLEKKQEELETYTNQKWGRVGLRFKKYMGGLGFILGRCKQMLEDDFLNDSSMADPYDTGVDKYLRTYININPASKNLELLKGTVGTILESIKRCVFIGLGAIAKMVNAVVGSSTFRYTVKTLLLTFIKLSQILNSLIGEGLNVAEAMLQDREITTQTDKIVGILRHISPDSIIEDETVDNLKLMFDPIFAKLQFLYSHPDVALKNVMTAFRAKMGGTQAPVQAQANGNNYSGHMVSRAGGTVSVGRAPAFASIMDSDTSKLIDTNMVGNADSEYGYVPSPLPVM